MGKKRNTYIPALRFRGLTRFYDPVLRAVLKEERLKRILVKQVHAEPGHRILDLGCGTATLSVMLKQAYPGATIVGLDIDPEVLAIARRKAALANCEIEFHQGLAYDPGDGLRFRSGSFDCVVSSLLFHHLTTNDKRRTFEKVRELLKPGGELLIVDWGKAQNPLMRVAFLGVQLLDGFSTTSDNVQGRLPALMRDAGLAKVEETHREMSLFGTLSFYRAVKEGGAQPPAPGISNRIES